MRHVVWIDPLGYIEGHGYRVSIVKEGETGHYPSGNWPYDGAKGHTLPWFWGPTLEDAEKAAVEYNQKMGISPLEAEKIILRSMGMFPEKPTKAQSEAFAKFFEDAVKMTKPKKPKAKTKAAKKKK